MAKVTNKESGLRNVGELIEALQKFDPKMPIHVNGESEATVFQAGTAVWIVGEDPWE